MGISFRSIRHQVQHHYAHWLNQARRAELEKQLTAVLGQPCRLRATLKRNGQDSHYYVVAGRQRLAVVRMVNPHRRVRTPNASTVRRREPHRLWREWAVYRRLGPKGLTPVALYRDDTTVVCSYVPGKRLADLTSIQPDRFWVLVEQAVIRLRELHGHGVVHMDASLNNVMLHEQTGQLLFIDFEHMPVPSLTRPQCEAFDYLHMIDASVKLMPPRLLEQMPRWVDLPDQHVPASIRGADLKPLHQALRRLPNSPSVFKQLQHVFARL